MSDPATEKFLAEVQRFKRQAEILRHQAWTVFALAILVMIVTLIQARNCP